MAKPDPQRLIDDAEYAISKIGRSCSNEDEAAAKLAVLNLVIAHANLYNETAKSHLRAGEKLSHKVTPKLAVLLDNSGLLYHIKALQ
mgnify:CR=1 FL=1